jgi:predicted amidohydrolase
VHRCFGKHWLDSCKVHSERPTWPALDDKTVVDVTRQDGVIFGIAVRPARELYTGGSNVNTVVNASGTVRRVGAVQLEAVLGDVDANVALAEQAVAEAVRQGAEVVALPEFFTSGVAFLPEVAAAAQPMDGPAVRALCDWARRHDVLISGSLLVRDADGHVRNAVLAVDPTGVRARHDKDLPTMWENALYVGGAPDDDGLAEIDGTAIGLAVCWELTRSATVHRLAGRVDLVLAGSGWWSVPRWRPRRLFDTWQQANAARARQTPGRFAAHVGAPVVHAAHSGPVDCPMPGFPGLRYRGHFEPATGIWDAAGAPVAVARGSAAQVVVADLPLLRTPPQPPPEAFWLSPPGPLPLFAWHQQRWHGRRWYTRHQVQGGER